jgi:hypothetical protein
MGANLSSNATGYLLIPKLTNGEYELNFGFAQSDKEQKFVVKVEGKDLGFSLKQELDNTWSLFNLVDFTLLKGLSVNIQPKEEKKQPELEIPAEPVKQISKEPVTVKEVTTSSKPAKVLPEIKKIYDKASEEGIDMVFVVSGSPRNDTVILFVPALKPKGAAGVPGESIRQQQKDNPQSMIRTPTYLAFTRPKLF